MSRVVLAMSGGVDSSVAAHLLVEQGHDVIGIFMRHGQQSPVVRETSDTSPASGRCKPAGSSNSTRLDHKQGCCTAADAEDARGIADKLDIPFHVLNFESEFSRIIDYFVDEYSAARTPNPCIVCNHWIKFGKLFDYADSVDAEFVATGHYARLLTNENGRHCLHRGQGAGKDQSYVLFGIGRELLPRMLLPIGNFEKSAIREIAVDLGLRVADKPDSQDICFVTEGRYDAFVRARRTASDRSESGRCEPAGCTTDTSGEIVTTDGTVVGQHKGIEGFTVGQRKGLGVALGEPRHVVRIERDSRRVVIGERRELLRGDLTAANANWHIDPPTRPMSCLAQIRYMAPAVPATVSALSDARFQILFNEPQFGVTPGQAVVCYESDRVLGGGWIE